MKNINIKTLLLCVLIFGSNQVFADVYITVNKKNASLCELIPTQSKIYTGHGVFHYNTEADQISNDLWNTSSAKRGLPFFKLNRSESQSQTVQLAFVEKYSTFWYYTKYGSDVKGPYFYDFIVPENSGRKFVNIDLDLPCSCFLRADRPSKCFANQQKRRSRDNIFQDNSGNWWEQVNSDIAKKLD